MLKKVVTKAVQTVPPPNLALYEHFKQVINICHTELCKVQLDKNIIPSTNGRGWHVVPSEGKKEIPEQVRDDNNSYTNAAKHDVVPLALRDDENTFPCPLGRGIKGEGLPHSKMAAFTLAEVLITLAIIGVVAAMTIPTLIQNQQNKTLQSQLKKSYSSISQALKLYQADTGSILTPNSGYIIKKSLVQYFKVAKDCGFGYGGDTKGCVRNNFNETGDSHSDTYNNLTNTIGIDMQYFDDGQFILTDGTLILIEDKRVPARTYISADLNGLNNKPNQLGRDLFMFQIDNDGRLLPMGAEGTDYYDENDAYCSYTSTEDMNGAGCTYKALYDKDYFKNLPK